MNKIFGKKYPLVVIFGKTNVGKSTLFNRLTEKKTALVSNISGTTRDPNSGLVRWRGKTFEFIDTGGISDLRVMGEKEGKNRKMLHPEDIEEKVQHQARGYLTRADLILFLVDAREGLPEQDRKLALALKKTVSGSGKILLVANKADNPILRSESAAFNKLGLGEPLPVSAVNGSGTGDLMDAVYDRIGQVASDEQEGRVGHKVKICIIGKPNVGKSSLVNSLLGEERVIVSPVPHTTREPQDIALSYGNVDFSLVDTAGITKKSVRSARSEKANNTLEKLSVEKSITTIKKSDIALLVLDISEDIGRQDVRLADEIIKNKKSLLIIANKWDLVKDKDYERFSRIICDKMPFVSWAPIEFVSALTGKKVKKILDTAIKVIEQRKMEISDNALDRFLDKIIRIHPPTKGKGLKKPYIKHIRQTETDPPFFSVRVGSKDSLDESYLRFIENRLREKFGFSGTPLTFYVEKPRKVHGKHEKNKN